MSAMQVMFAIVAVLAMCLAALAWFLCCLEHRVSELESHRRKRTGEWVDDPSEVDGDKEPLPGYMSEAEIKRRRSVIGDHWAV